MSGGGHQVVLTLPGKLYLPVEQDTTKWFIIQLLDTKLDWREALKDARLRIDDTSGALHAPHASEGLGLQVDTEAAPAHMLVLKPSVDGSNTVLPAGRVSACIKIGSLLQRSDDLGAGKEGLLKLVPLPTGETSNNVPVAFWRLGPAIPEDGLLKTLSFACVSNKPADRRGEIFGSFKVAPKMQLVGRTVKLDGATYLVGAVAGGTKKMLLYEAEIYWVERNGEFGRNKADEQRQEAEERKVADFRSQRSEVIQLSGAAGKKRQEASKEMRMVDESKVANLDECMSELTSRAGTFEDMSVIKENDAMKLKEELLPHFDTTATEPKNIYAKGLQRMLPDQILAAENGLRDDKMTVMFQEPSRIQATPVKELQDVFKTRVGARLAKARAEANQSESYDAAEITARRFSALNLLIKLYKVRKPPRFKIAEFRAALEIAEDTWKLTDHMFDYFLRGTPTDKRTRTINRKKLVCHIIVLVLDLSLRYKVDFQPLQDELKMDISEMEENLRYVGCEVQKKGSSDNVSSAQISLETELKAPLSFQSAKGKGRGRKRGRD